jgi:hypothetical protein
MPYLLRLFDKSDNRLLVTTKCDSLEEAGRRRAEFPLGELVVIEPGQAGQGGSGHHVELVRRDDHGEEHPITQEEDAVFSRRSAVAGSSSRRNGCHLAHGAD